MGIHKYESRMNTVLKLLERTEINAVNKAYLFSFIDYLKASGMSKPRIERYIYTLPDDTYEKRGRAYL